MRYVIVFIDDFTRSILHWAFLPSKEARLTADELRKCIIKVPGQRFGVLHSDCGTEFRSFFDLVLQKHGILHWRTWSYHPWSNGKVERFNGDIKYHIGEKYSKLDKYINKIYQRIPHSVTKKAPGKYYWQCLMNHELLWHGGEDCVLQIIRLDDQPDQKILKVPLPDDSVDLKVLDDALLDQNHQVLVQQQEQEEDRQGAEYVQDCDDNEGILQYLHHEDL